MRTAILFGLVLLLASFGASAASFDCKKAKTGVEKKICADPELSRMDDDLAALYAGVKELTEDKDKRAAQLAGQRAWLENRNQCRATDCLLRAYGARNEALRANGPTHSYRRIVPTPDLRIIENRPLCERFVGNLRAAHAHVAPNCELKIDPKYANYFSLPQWEELDPWQHLDWLWQMDTDANSIYYIANKLERLKEDQKAWEGWFKERIEARDSGPWVPERGEGVGQRLEAQMVRGRFDLDGDGKVDTVLAYRIAPPCDPETTGAAGYHPFVFDETTGQVRRGYFDVKLRFLHFVPVLYKPGGSEKRSTKTLFFDSATPVGYGEGRHYQNVGLWADDDPQDDYIGLIMACGVTVNHLHREARPK